MSTNRKKWPSKWQRGQFFHILSLKEKIVFFSLFMLFLISFSSLAVNFYFENTVILSDEGGEYTEGIIGQPRFINPIYAQTSDTDRDLVEILFSGLMKYNNKGEIIPDLAREYKVIDEGKTYVFYLKDNLFWSDGNPLTVDDVIFTIKSIQSPDIKSPLRANWLGVETEKISDLEVRIKLKNPSSIFLQNAALKIIPKHIWQDTPSSNFILSSFNLKPVGSGPYKIENLPQTKDGEITSLSLIRNTYYHGKTANILRITFLFFNNEKDLAEGYKKGGINGFSLPNSTNTALIDSSANSYSFSLPRYFAVFFNPQKTKTLAGEDVRQALSYGTNKLEIINRVLSGKGAVVDSPILPDIYGFENPSTTYAFDREKANAILENAGFLKNESGIREKFVKKALPFQFKNNLTSGSQGAEVKELQKCLSRFPDIYPDGTISGYFGPKTKAAVILFQEKYKDEILKPSNIEKGTGDVKAATMEKLNEVCFEKPAENITLKISLSTADQPQLIETANMLKENWRALGVEVDINIFDIGTLEREIIKPRDYDALLFGAAMGMFPDPYPFWHSSQKKDPGLNLAVYENKDADSLLEKIRKGTDDAENKKALEKFQNILIKDAPAVFLYNPDYTYFVSPDVKGIDKGIIIDPSKRFAGIENWYFKTKRVWK